MVVVSYRPELEVDWGRHDHHLHIQLRPLVQRHSAELLRGVLGVSELPAGLVERIHERTGGNPLFIEEMARALLDDGVLQVREGRAALQRDLDSLELPGNVQGLIRSRLDRLARHDRDTLGLASVVGRQFSRPVLERLSSAPTRLSAALDVLQSLDLIHQVRVVPEAVYAFKQLLTQEVAYETLLRERRRELHGLAGRAIEELHRERLDEQVELLVHHYGLAEEWRKAALYARRSGEKAHALSQFQQAARFFEQGAAFLDHLSQEREVQLLKVDLRLEACFCYVNLGRFDEAIAAGEKVEADVDALADAHRRVRLLVMFGTCYMYRGDRERCERYLLPALDMKELQGNALSLANCKHVLAGCYVGQGLWNLASPYLEEAVRIYEQEGVEDEYLYGYYVLPYVVGCAQLGLTWAFQGRVADAAELFRKTLPRAQGRVANFATKGVYFSWLSVFSALVGEDRLSIQPVVELMVRKAESSDSPFLLLAGRVVQTNMLLALGRMQEARDLARQVVAALAGKPIRTGHLANLYHNLILAETLLDDLDAARQHLGEARPLTPLSPHWFGPRFDMLEGLIAARAGDGAAAQAFFERSVAGDLEAGAEVLADQTRYQQALALAHEGDGQQAARQLGELERRFSMRGMPTWQRLCARARAELA
jgi:tetratricopeptide (TPR) repeat protein